LEEIKMANDMRDQLGIAIVGTGYWGVNHVRVFTELPQVRAVTLVDLRPERLEEVGKRFPGVTLFTGIEDALRSENVDAVVVCTPATTHYEVARRCLEAGKHVLVEKPITTRVTEAEELNKLAEATGLTLMVGHTFIYNPGVRKVKNYIQQGAVGQIYYLYAQRTNLGPIRSDVNALWDLAPHDVSIFNYFLDSSPTWVTAVAGTILQNCCEDFGFISLGYEDGTIGHIHVSWADPKKVRQVVLVGSEKRIVFDDLKTTEPVRIFEKGVMPSEDEASTYGEYHFQIRDGDILSPKVEVSEPLKNQCRHFLECAIQGNQPVTHGRSGLEVVKVMVAIDRSLELNGAPVSVQDTRAPVSVPYVGVPIAFSRNRTPVSAAMRGLVATPSNELNGISVKAT
jgi:predicted dehydrogenase